jgi:hypothetical protein
MVAGKGTIFFLPPVSMHQTQKAAKFLHNYEFGEEGKRTVVLKHPILKIMDS